MCTVSYFPGNNQIVLTSSRDEHIGRPQSLSPAGYLYNQSLLYYPADPLAGGTWFSVTQSGSVLILLNGAWLAHTVKASYRKSRGLILLELASTPHTLNCWMEIDLTDIEPFTIITSARTHLFQLVWDGVSKEVIKLHTDKSAIWSSSTLYTDAVKRERQKWFADFLADKSNSVTETDLMSFHKYTYIDDSENGLIIRRINQIQTRSITQAVIDSDGFSLRYFDLSNGEETLLRHTF